MTYAQAIACLPSDAYWTCSFGNPGDLSCTEYWRTKDGRRWNIIKPLYEQHWCVNRISDAVQA